MLNLQIPLEADQPSAGEKVLSEENTFETGGGDAYAGERDQGFLVEGLGAWCRWCGSLFLANCAIGYVALSLGFTAERKQDPLAVSRQKEN